MSRWPITKFMTVSPFLTVHQAPSEIERLGMSLEMH